jgi:hypothetical protein
MRSARALSTTLGSQAQQERRKKWRFLTLRYMHMPYTRYLSKGTEGRIVVAILFHGFERTPYPHIGSTWSQKECSGKVTKETPAGQLIATSAQSSSSSKTTARRRTARTGRRTLDELRLRPGRLRLPRCDAPQGTRKRTFPRTQWRECVAGLCRLGARVALGRRV